MNILRKLESVEYRKNKNRQFLGDQNSGWHELLIKVSIPSILIISFQSYHNASFQQLRDHWHGHVNCGKVFIIDSTVQSYSSLHFCYLFRWINELLVVPWENAWLFIALFAESLFLSSIHHKNLFKMTILWKLIIFLRLRYCKLSFWLIVQIYWYKLFTDNQSNMLHQRIWNL